MTEIRPPPSRPRRRLRRRAPIAAALLALAAADVGVEVSGAAASSAWRLGPALPGTPTLRSALAFAHRGDWGHAEAVAAGAADPLVPKLVRWLDLQRPDAGHDFEEIAGFVEANPDWPRQAMLRQRAEDAMDQVPDDRLRRWFALHPPVGAFAKMRAALLLDPTGNVAEAKAMVRDAWIAGDFNEVDEKLALARFGALLSQDDHAKRLDHLLWAGRPEQAQRMLGRVSDDWRILAEARLEYARGSSAAEVTAARVPAALRDNPGLLFDRVRWARRRGLDDAALAILEHPPQDLVHPEYWWTERQAIARDLLAGGQAERAYRLVSMHQMIDGAAMIDAEFMAGWMALRFLHRPGDALQHFQAIYARAKTPLSLSRGAYWAGRAAEADAKPDLARGWYDKAVPYITTYYGQLAAAEPGTVAPPAPAPEPHADPGASARFERREFVRAIRLLASVGEDDAIRPFFTVLNQETETVAEHALVADLAEGLGRPDLGVAAAKQAASAGVQLFRAGYPIVPLPRNAGAEQALLLAITRQESAFDRHAVSPSGARGLMQLEPGTARLTAKTLQIPYAEPRLTADALYNVSLGQAYLDGLIADFNGSYVLAIAAYNAGPARVRQWIDQFGDPRDPKVDAIDWIEQIPFSETRNYVQRVLENLQVYRLRFGDRKLAFSLQADLKR